MWHVLRRPFKLHSLNAHDPLPGHGQQELHSDWGGERGAGYHVVNSMWILDDMSADNGATRIVPGSHRFPGAVGQEVLRPPGALPGRGPACRPRPARWAIFNGSAWHSCTRNRSGAPRRLLHCAFIAREHRQQTGQREYLRPETGRRLTPLARYVLDV